MADAKAKIGAKIALDGEREYKQAIKDIAKEQSVLRSEMKLVASQFADNSKSAQALTETNDVLARQIETQKNKIELLKSALEAANTEYGEGSTQSQNWQIQLNNAQVQLNDMNRALDANTKALDEMAENTDDTESETEDLSKALKENELALGSAENGANEAGEEINELGQSMDEAGDKALTFGEMVKANLTADVIMGGVGKIVETLKDAGEYAIKVGSDFEASMSEVQAISGATSSDLEKMSSKAKELGASSKYSATEASQAFKYMALAGWDTSKSISAIDGVMNLAAASGMELAKASDMVTDYLSAFGMEASQASYMADMLAYAQGNSNTTAEQLGEAYKNCAANMNAAGQDIETTTAMLEALANQGSKSSEAGTKVTAMMRDLTAKMDDGKIAIGDTTVAVMNANGNFRDMTDILIDIDAATQGMGDAQKAAALASTFTSDSIAGLNMILNEGVDKIANYEVQLRNSNGTAEAMANTMQDNLQGKITNAGSALEGLGIAAYNYISGPAGKVVDLATGMFRGLTDVLTPELDTAHQLLADAESTADAVQEIYDKVDEQKKSFESTQDSIEANAELAKRLTDNLFELAGKTDLSATELQTMGIYVDELNTLIPDMNLSLNNQTGELSKTREEVDALTQSYKEQAIQQAFLEHYNELATDCAAAIQTAAQAKRNFDVALADPAAQAVWEEYQNKAKEFNAAGEEMEDAYIHAGNAIWATNKANGDLLDGLLSSEEAMNAANTAVDDCNNSMEEWETTMADYKESVEPVVEETENATDTIQKMGDAEEDTEESTDGLAEVFQRYANQTGQSVEEISEAYDKLKQEYDSAYESAYNSIQGQIDLTKKHEEQEAISAASILENLASHVSAMQTYAENLKAVNAGIVDDQGNTVAALNEDFLAYLNGLGEDGANIIASISAEISAGNTQFISDLNNQWETGMTISQSVATETANAKSQFDEYCAKMDEASAQAVENAAQAGDNAGKTYTSFQEAALELGLIDCEGEITSYENSVDAKQEEFGNIGTETADAYTENLQTGISQAADGVTGEVDGIEGTISGKKGTFGEDGAGAAGAYVDEMTGKFFGSVVSIGLSLLAISGEVALFNSTMSRLGGDASDNFTSKVVSGLSASGPNAAEGFIGGLENSIWGSMERVRRAAQAVVDRVNATLKIHSPSKVLEESGKFSGEGYAIGFEKSMEKAADLAEVQAVDFNKSVLASAEDLQLRASDLQLRVAPQKNGVAEDLVNLLTTYLPIIASHKQVVMSTGALVGELTNAMNRALQAESRREARYV